jgi:hypothetical protein
MVAATGVASGKKGSYVTKELDEVETKKVQKVSGDKSDVREAETRRRFALSVHVLVGRIRLSREARTCEEQEVVREEGFTVGFGEHPHDDVKRTQQLLAARVPA